MEHHAIDQKKLQDRIDAIPEWARDWEMEVHPDKAKILRQWRKPMDGVHTQWSTSESCGRGKRHWFLG